MKSLKYLFTVPEGEPVTDRHFRRILISSVCGILLCMTCLVSMTWAWYTVSIETNPATLQVASHYVALEKELNPAIKTYEAGEYQLKLEFVTDASDAELSNSFYEEDLARYIIISVYKGDTLEGSYYVRAEKPKDGMKNWYASVMLDLDEARNIKFHSSWSTEDAEPLENNILAVYATNSIGKEESTGGTDEGGTNEGSEPVEGGTEEGGTDEGGEPVEGGETTAPSDPVESSDAVETE